MIQWFTHSKQCSLLATYWHNNVVTCRRASWTNQWTNLNLFIEQIQKIRSQLGESKHPVLQCASVRLLPSKQTHAEGKRGVFSSVENLIWVVRAVTLSLPPNQALNSCTKCVNTNTENEHLTLKCTQNWLHIAKYSLYTWWHVNTTLLHYLPRI